MKAHSDKLKTAMTEIHATLLKHDIAALVFLHEPGEGDGIGFSEYMVRIDPSWSVMHFEEVNGQKVGIRFRAKEADFVGGKATQKLMINNSINMLVHFRDLCTEHLAIALQLLDKLNKKFQITEGEAVHTPHDEGTS